MSAHWYIEDAALTVSTAPRTIHDFGGFPRELYQVQYPAPGDPDLAVRVQKLLAPFPVRLDERWGLDHGTWAVLSHVYPHADVPVVQLSIDETQPPSFHYEIGKRLAPCRRRASSSSAAATSCTICTHTHGAGIPSSPINGLWRSRRESANYCSRRKPIRSSTTKTSSARRRCWLSRRLTTTCRCCTSSVRARRPSPSRSRLRAWTAARFRCSQCRWVNASLKGLPSALAVSGRWSSKVSGAVLSLAPQQGNCGSLILGRRLLLATALLRGSRAAFALEEKKRNEQKTSNRKPCEKSSDQVQRVKDCCNRHCIGEDRDQPCSDHLKNESAPDSKSHGTLVRTALPRSLLTTSLRIDLRSGNGSKVLRAALLGYSHADVTRITKLEGFKRHHILSMTRISCSVNVFAAL